MRCKSNKIILVVFFLMFFVLTSSVLAQSTDTSFQQAVTEYQQSPTYATAEKVIKLALAMVKLPAITEEARKHFVRGAALFKEAKTSDDFSQVMDEFKQAILLAPWWADAHNNQALACEAAGKYTSAIENLKLYQLFKLSDTEARAVQDKIYALEAKQEKASLQNVQEKEAKLKTVEGEWYYMSPWGQAMTTSTSPILKISKQNGEWALDDGLTKEKFYNSHVVVTNTSASFDRDTYTNPEFNHGHFDLHLSEDGTKLTGTYTDTDTSRTPQSQTESTEFVRKK